MFTLFVREEHRCKSFQWFMEEIAYDIPMHYPLPPKNVEWGEVSHLFLISQNWCSHWTDKNCQIEWCSNTPFYFLIHHFPFNSCPVAPWPYQSASILIIVLHCVLYNTQQINEPNITRKKLSHTLPTIILCKFMCIYSQSIQIFYLIENINKWCFCTDQRFWNQLLYRQYGSHQWRHSWDWTMSQDGRKPGNLHFACVSCIAYSCEFTIQYILNGVMFSAVAMLPLSSHGLQ